MDRGEATADAVIEWLDRLGLGQYADSFRRNAITWDLVGELTDQDLRELGVSALGHRKHLLKAIAALGRDDARSEVALRSRVAMQRAQAERRQITVLFCDLVNSVPLSLRFDPEDLSEILSAFQFCCDGVVRRFGGYVAGFTGDGLKAFFGYPQATEHDPDQALRAGLALVSAVGALKVHPDLTLSIRVAIATGDVVVGEVIGSAEVYERTVVGEAPNLAARLLAMGDPGSVVISDATKQLVGRVFEYDDLGVHRLKGFRLPVQAWRVLRESKIQSRFEATRGEHLTPLIDRTEELSRLRQLWLKAKSGEGQVLLVSGEAGVGKSRLSVAFQQTLRDDTFSVASYYGFPFYQSSALYPIIVQVQDAARLSPDDSSETRLDKLEAFLVQCAPELRDLTPLFASLLSIPLDDRYPALDLTPQQQKRHTLDALERQAGVLAARAPVLMVFEDLQWMDPSTLELIERLIRRIVRLPILLIATFRPDFTTSWEHYAHVSSLSVPRLSRNDSGLLVGALVSKSRLTAATLQQILDHSDGVPLFLEELTKASIEVAYDRDGELERNAAAPMPTVRVPRTLHDSLVARLDRLAAWKEIVLTASVIGRRFSRELLASLFPGDRALLAAALDGLVEAEILLPAGDTAEARYTFKHALMQEAASATLLRSERAVIHGRIARALQENFPDTVNSEPELLAFHCSGAGLVEAAIGYWQRAAQRALRRWANLEALEHFRQALALLAGQPPGEERDRQELDLQTSLGATLTTVKGFAAPDVATAYERARALCSESHDVTQRFSVLRGLWVYDLVRAEWHAASDLAREMLTLARSRRDPGYELEAHRALGITLAWRGELVRGHDHLEQGYRIYDSQQHQTHAIRYGNDPGVACLIHAAFAEWLLGRVDQALAKSRDALALARRLAHPFSLAQALVYLAFIHQFRREPECIHALVEEAKGLAIEHGFPFWLAEANIMGGWARCAEKETDAGLSQLRSGIDDFLATGAQMDKPRWLAILAEAYGEANRTQEGLDAIAEALVVVRETGECIFEARLRQLSGELLLSQDNDGADGRAETCFLDALAAARGQHAKSWELRAATSLARLWHRQARCREARDVLAPVYASFAEGFETVDLKSARALLTELA